MKRRAIAVILVGLLCLTGIAYAGVSANYDLSWNVIGGGGGPLDSASYAMRSTVGQIIGLSSSDNYQLGAGYWNGISAVPTPSPAKFDTGHGTYPSIMGTHTGNFTPKCNITVHQIYTYPCAGTGGHSERVIFCDYETGVTKINESWGGYLGDYHNITVSPSVKLLKNRVYNYTIITGSYPQIIHNQSLSTANGTITCMRFTDANGREYNDWIPAIRLE
jgi:hypothetical protein